ncbi:hypothetical protein ACUR5C_09820 [Aliikangiella sp. IMCC44653]
MNNEMFSWLLVLEIVLPFVILSIVLILVILKGRKNNKEAARFLIEKIKSNEDSQRKEIFNFLKNQLNLDKNIAKRATRKITNDRKFLFRNLISGMLNKNPEAIASLELDMSRIFGHYHDLTANPVTTDAAPEGAPESNTEENTEDLKALKKEIKLLKQEIHVTLTTLNNIFGEFSSMFGEEVPSSEMSVEQIITAMESFAGAKVNTDAVVAEMDQTDAGKPAVSGNAQSAASANEGNSDDKNSPVEEDTLEDTSNLDKTLAELEAKAGEPDANIIVDDESVEPMEDDLLEQAVEDLLPELQDEPSPQVPEEVETAESFSEKLSAESKPKEEKDELDFSIDSELDDIDSALDELELGTSDDEPSWDEAFEESGDKKEGEK